MEFGCGAFGFAPLCAKAAVERLAANNAAALILMNIFVIDFPFVGSARNEHQDNGNADNNSLFLEGSMTVAPKAE
jgi:hypothetical protein